MVYVSIFLPCRVMTFDPSVAVMLRLLDLPAELLEEILFYLSPSHLLSRVSLTCRRLRELLHSDSLWRRRYAAFVRAPPTLSPAGASCPWRRGCVEAQFSLSLARGEPAISLASLTGRGATHTHTRCVSFS